MIGRVVEIAGDDRHLSLLRGFMLVRSEGSEIARIPLDDIGVLVANGHGLSYSHNLLLALADRGVAMVLCGTNQSPAAWLWPVAGHHAQTANMLAQSVIGKPLAKRLWQGLVVAKVAQQAAVLDIAGKPSGGIAALGRKVRSGDPENIEAQAARRYWPLLMGPDFRRDRSAPGANALLNYGYTILRSMTARSVAAAGLHPSLGLHHRTRTDPLCLASDLMEPFRPLIDLAVFRLIADGNDELTPEVKAVLAAVTSVDMRSPRGTTPLATCIERLATSVARACVDGTGSLDLPLSPQPLDAAWLGRVR
ncbi:MAG: type II CRISPR-associated endonuclease Cas1 [Alphaproteobacteria bacterium]